MKLKKEFSRFSRYRFGMQSGSKSNMNFIHYFKPVCHVYDKLEFQNRQKPILIFVSVIQQHSRIFSITMNQAYNEKELQEKRQISEQENIISKNSFLTVSIDETDTSVSAFLIPYQKSKGHSYRELQLIIACKVSYYWNATCLLFMKNQYIKHQRRETLSLEYTLSL